MQPTENKGLVKTFNGIGLAKHRLVKFATGDHTVEAATAATHFAIGATDEIGSHDNGRVDVVLDGIVYVEASAAIARGAKITAAAGGKAVTAAADNKAAGWAMSPADADGDLIAVYLERTTA